MQDVLKECNERYFEREVNMTENMMLCGYLGICSCYDCRDRRIPLWLLRMGIGMGILYAGIMLFTGRAVWQTVLTGALPGAAMLFYSRMSQEKLGWADGLMVIPAGLIQQWERCTAEVLTACFLIFLVAVGLLLSGKGNKNTRLPFAPFFLSAVAILWITDVCKGGIGG